MGTLALAADERAAAVEVTEDTLSVSLMDGRTISVPLAWYPRLLNASPAQRQSWQIAGGGYGIHWPDVDEDLSTEGLLRGAPAPERSQKRTTRAGKERRGKGRKGERWRMATGTRRGPAGTKPPRSAQPQKTR
jgi:hypothetical protein